MTTQFTRGKKNVTSIIFPTKRLKNAKMHPSRLPHQVDTNLKCIGLPPKHRALCLHSGFPVQAALVQDS